MSEQTVFNATFRSKARIGQLLGLGLLAGTPAIIGAWIGGFAYSAIWAAFFLAIGAGAIFQVAIEIIARMQSDRSSPFFSLHNVTGFTAGLIVMYVTGFAIAG